MFLDNNDGGSTGRASVFVDVGGTLATDDFADLTINNGDPGGTINSSASLTLAAGTISIGGSLDINIFNNSGGSIVGDAILSVTSSGGLTTGADSGFSIDNSIFSNEALFVGGEITSNATINLSAANISAGGGLFTFIYNDGGGHIGGNAVITANVSLPGITGNLTTQGDLFFDIQNSADTDGTTTLPGGKIDGSATVLVAVSGNIVSQGLAEFAVLNNDFRFLSLGGTISGDATVSLIAGGISTTGFFQPLVNNTNGTIGGEAGVAVDVTGDINVGAETFFNLRNSGGSIGTEALSILTANNYTSGSTFGFQILNDNGSIGGSATLAAALSGSLTSVGDASVQIINTGGTIGGNATIDLSAANLTADSSVFAQIDNTEGTIGGSATIDSTFTGAVTVSGDANVNIFGSDAAGGAAINFNGGTYNVSGTFLSTIDGNGAITFNTASVNADVLKVGVFGSNGTLTIGGGTLSGDTELKLYASGSNGRINFISNVSLNSNSSVIIAANAVTINNGVVVTITGDDGVSASVFTNVPNYTGSGGNGSTTGTFAGNGATTAPLDQAPPFDGPPRSKHSGSSTAPTGSNGGGAHHRGVIVRVTDSNDLLDLANRVVSGQPATAGGRPNASTKPHGSTKPLPKGFPGRSDPDRAGIRVDRRLSALP